MKISIIQQDGIVVVDGVARRVDLSDLDERIHSIQFDTDKNGWIEYDGDAMEEVEVRDFDAEAKALVEARRRNLKLPEGPIMKKGKVRMGNKDFSDYNVVAKYVERWMAAAPPSPPAPTPEELAARERNRQRLAGLDKAIAQTALGQTTPRNLETLQEMTSAELAAWFDENFRNEPQRRELERWMLLTLIRRLS